MTSKHRSADWNDCSELEKYKYVRISRIFVAEHFLQLPPTEFHSNTQAIMVWKWEPGTQYDYGYVVEYEGEYLKASGINSH